MWAVALRIKLMQFKSGLSFDFSFLRLPPEAPIGWGENACNVHQTNQRLTRQGACFWHSTNILEYILVESEMSVADLMRASKTCFSKHARHVAKLY